MKTLKADVVMDRFSWSDGIFGPDEQLVTQQNGVRIYEGENRTSFEHGKAILTSHRILWKDYKNQDTVLSLPLSLVVFSEEHPGGFGKCAKLVLHLAPAPAYKAPGPVNSSSGQYIRLGFKDGGETEFLRCLQEAVGRSAWTQLPRPVTAGVKGKEFRTGIGGIQKHLDKKNKETDKNISVAFEDLDNLMKKAKEMVTLSKNVANKIKEKQGEITEDETIRFKSYLLSLGIADPVTRETHGKGDKYFRELAKQIAQVLEQPLKECGGMMTMPDVYCRVNRARGMELLSPDDMINSCKLMAELRLPVRLRVFESGVMVLMLQSHSEEEVVKQTAVLVEDKGSITAEDLSKLIGLSVVLSKERLLSAERSGKLCRDESVEGLKFYPNLFLNQPV